MAEEQTEKDELLERAGNRIVSLELALDKLSDLALDVKERDTLGTMTRMSRQLWELYCQWLGHLYMLEKYGRDE